MTTTVVTYTTEASGAQDGTFFFGGGWDGAVAVRMELDANLVFPSFGGVIFNLAPTLDSVGRPLDAPIISALELRLTTYPELVADPGAEVLEVWAVPEFVPADYSAVAGLQPFSRDEILVAATTATFTGVATVVSWTLGVYLTAGDAQTATCEENLTTARSYWAGSRWGGRIALSLRANGPSVGSNWGFNTAEAAGQAPQLLVTQSPFHSGHRVGGVGLRARARHCARSGLPAMTSKLVEDGYVRGVHVLPGWYDREDRAGLDIELPSTEGEVDDRNTGAS